MLPPQLQQASGLRPCLRQLSSVNKSKPILSIQAASFTCWQKQREWDSHLDPVHERCLQGRSISTRAESKRGLRRQDKWDRVAPTAASWDRRHASHSKKGSRRSSQAEDEDQDSTRSLRDARRQRLDRIRERFDSKFGQDPYEAVFGKRFEPFWKRLTPDFLKQELAWQTPVESELASAAGAQQASPKSKSKSFAQSRTFQMRASHRSGSKPHMEASSASWDSETNKIRKASYDPISGRMVEEATTATPVGETQSPHSHEKPAVLHTLPQDDVDPVTADNIRASMGKPDKPLLQHLAARTQQLANMEEDYNNRDFENEHDELVAARKTLEALRAQVQILERKAHASTLTKPDLEDAERPAFFEDGWNDAPQGMQIAFENEKDAYGHGTKKTLEQEMNALNSRQVEEINDGYEASPTGMQTQFEKEDPSTFEHELNHKHDREEYDDGYSNAPIGMQTQHQTEDPDSLEQELNKKLEREVYEDGYSQAPIGMQTQHEREDPMSLEEELNKKLQREVYDDGYSNAPTGMQNQHENEDPTTLEAELNKKLQREVYDDGYSHAPTGMQNQHANEDPSTLEAELNKKLQREVYDDGYSHVPTGMQNQHEREDPTVLEQELNERLPREVYDDGYSNVPVGMQTQHQAEDASLLEQELNKKLQREVYDDGYSNTPTGMQTQHEREDIGVLEKELNDNLKRKEYDDGYSRLPIGMQTQHQMEGANLLEQDLDKLNKLKHEIYEDGYSTAPVGMQNQHENEGADALENDLAKLQNLKREIYDDGYSNAPSGLQTAFRSEGGRSLEDELKANNIVQEQEDGYSKTPIGMQNSFRNEEATASQQGGEGDLCRNVGKFCTSRRWYKQSATNNLSEELQKAHQRTLDGALVREVKDIYETNYGPITAEHRQPVGAVADPFEGRVDGLVHRALDEHGDGKGYEFREDSLEEELDGKSKTGASTTPKQTKTPPVEWAEPPVYKVVAYDVNKELISITTTPSNFSTSETPISISNALSRLHQPARFIPYFAELQKTGFQVIHASRDWLVLRKVDPGERATPVPETIVNPVDLKMSRNIPFEEPVLGRFASPTGFVNYDPIFPPEPPKPAPDAAETVTVEIPVRNSTSESRHRRIRREEDVFSGRQRWRERRSGEHEKRGKRTIKDRAVWALSVGATSAALMYVFGVAGELAKKT